MRFLNPEYLWLLLAIPLLIVVRFLAWQKKKKNIRKFGDSQLVKQLMPDVSKYRGTIKFCLLLSALALIIIVVARPQIGSKISREKRNGIETMICLDISNSMLAEDVTPSRLMKSKLLVENLVDNFTNDKIGLIVYAGDAFVQLPITSDYVSAKMFLQSIEPNLIETQGTDIARAVHLAMNSFTQAEKIGRAIILITDGEDHEGGAKEAVEEAKKKGINVFILGIGDVKGAPIPTSDGGYMKDRSGQTVMTKLNEDMCRELAQAGSGKYIHVDNTSDAQEKLNNELSKLQKGESESVIYSEYAEQFQIFALLALLLLIIEVCVQARKNPALKNLTIFGRKAKTTMILLVFSLTCSTMQAQTDRQHIRQGNRQFKLQKTEQAETEYRKALAKNPQNPQALYNLGCAYLAQQKDSAATTMFEKSAKIETSKKRKALCWHNIGVILQKHQLYGDAIKAYEESLRNNPSDDETRYNLALCKKQQKKNQNNNGGGGNNKDKNNKEKNDSQKNQDKKDQQQKDQQKQEQKQQEQMSKENAEQLLNAAMQEEKNTQQRLKKNMRQSNRRQLERNW